MEQIISNDEPCTAITLSVNSSCVYTDGSNLNATRSVIGTNSGLCAFDILSKDVWFKFTAPISGRIKVQTQAGTLTDGVMTLYRMSLSCTSLFACCLYG